jgi:N4-gp56 family major capsid protein
MPPIAVPTSYEGNIGIQEAALTREFFPQMFFSRFVGFSEPDPMGMTEVTSPRNPIVARRQLAASGYDNLKVPMLRKLTNAPTYGDQQLEGNGEAQTIYFNDVYINQDRHAVMLASRMANQRIKLYQLAAQVRPQLSDWLSANVEVQCASAFYDTNSRNITAAALNGGLGVTATAHPVIYEPGSGRITWSATNATYRQNLYTAINALTGTDVFNYAYLAALRTEVRKRRIPPIKTAGQDLWMILVHHNQAKQLRADTAWQQAQREAGVRDLLQNPMFSGAMGYAEGFVIFERELAVFGVDLSVTNTVSFGATNPLSAPDSLPNKAAIIFGEQAMSWGWALGPQFDEDSFNLGNRKEVAISLIHGFKLNTFVDNSATPTDFVNQTSMLAVSYSPDTF